MKKLVIAIVLVLCFTLSLKLSAQDKTVDEYKAEIAQLKFENKRLEDKLISHIQGSIDTQRELNKMSVYYIMETQRMLSLIGSAGTVGLKREFIDKANQDAVDYINKDPMPSFRKELSMWKKEMGL